MSTEALIGGSSSQEYRAAVEQIMNLFEYPYLQDVANISVQDAYATYNAEMFLENVLVSFSDAPSRRKRRSTGVDTTITAIYTIYVSNSSDVSAVEESARSSIMSAATEAISDNGGAYISTSAEPSVSVSMNDTWTPDYTDYSYPDEDYDYSDYYTEFQTDECALETYDCDNNAKCIDTDTSYTCECNPGFEGDGTTCIGRHIFFCKNFVSFLFRQVKLCLLLVE